MSNDTGNIFTDTRPCTGCGADTAIINLFPQGMCPACYERVHANDPLTHDGLADMTRTFRSGAVLAKYCASCGAPIANAFRVRTCQACREKQRKGQLAKGIGRAK